MPLTSRMAGFLDVSSGNILNVGRNFAVTDTPTKVFNQEATVVLPLVLDQQINFDCDVTVAKLIFIESDNDINIKLNVITNTPILVKEFILLRTDAVVAIYISNPSATLTATLTITVAGD